MSFWTKEEHIITVDKNDSQKIMVNRCLLKDKEFIDIRIYYKDKTTEELQPSNKGVSIPLEKSKIIIDAIIDNLKNVAE